MRITALFALVTLCAFASQSYSDRVVTPDKTYSGEISSMTYEEVVIKVHMGGTLYPQSVKSMVISEISLGSRANFDRNLKNAEDFMEAQTFEKAVPLLSRIEDNSSASMVSRQYAGFNLPR